MDIKATILFIKFEDKVSFLFQKGHMKFCPFLALLVRVTGCLGGESWGRKTGVAKSQDFVVGQLEFWQNKSTYLVEEEHQISVRGEKILILVVINCCKGRLQKKNGITWE